MFDLSLSGDFERLVRLSDDIPTTGTILLHLHRRFGMKCRRGESIVSLIACQEGSLL